MTTERKTSSALPQPFVGVKGAKAPNYPPNGVTIYNVETGEVAVTKPINAHEAVDGGHWSYEPQMAKTKATGSKIARVKAADDSEGKGDGVDGSDARAARAKKLNAMHADKVHAIAAKLEISASTKADAVEGILAAEFPA